MFTISRENKANSSTKSRAPVRSRSDPEGVVPTRKTPLGIRVFRLKISDETTKYVRQRCKTYELCKSKKIREDYTNINDFVAIISNGFRFDVLVTRTLLRFLRFFFFVCTFEELRRFIALKPRRRFFVRIHLFRLYLAVRQRVVRVSKCIFNRP